MLIQVEDTPNPNSLKFVPLQQVKKCKEYKEYQFYSKKETLGISPFAAELLTIPGITQVFLQSNAVVINKQAEVEWFILKPQVIGIMMEYIVEKLSFVLEDKRAVYIADKLNTTLSTEDGSIADDLDTTLSTEDGSIADELNTTFSTEDGSIGDDLSTTFSEVEAKIITLLQEKIRPFVQQDGGDITFKSFDSQKGIVYVQMAGACVGCPSSTATLKSGVENMLRYYVPEVQEVEQI